MTVHDKSFCSLIRGHSALHSGGIRSNGRGIRLNQVMRLILERKFTCFQPVAAQRCRVDEPARSGPEKTLRTAVVLEAEKQRRSQPSKIRAIFSNHPGGQRAVCLLHSRNRPQAKQSHRVFIPVGDVCQGKMFVPSGDCMGLSWNSVACPWRRRGTPRSALEGSTDWGRGAGKGMIFPCSSCA